MALVLPPYHLSQLALGVVGGGRHESAAMHWEVLLASTLICLGVARIGVQRDQGKLYGRDLYVRRGSLYETRIEIGGEFDHCDCGVRLTRIVRRHARAVPSDCWPSR